MMRQISKLPFILKWGFPIFWFGLLGLITIVGLTNGRAHTTEIIAPIVLAVFGLFIMKKLIWELADEVFDGGDFLLFRKGDLEQRVQLQDITNIEHAALSSPPRVTIYCRTPGALGTKLAFTLSPALNPFAKPKIFRELSERIDRLDKT